MKAASGIALTLVAFVAVSCRTVPSPPAANLSAPGWRVREGEAVWKPGGKRPELAGELMVATNANGDFFVRFSKTPFDLASARRSGGIWRIDLGEDRYSRGGRGEIPERFVWFELPRFLAGRELGKNWRSETKPDGGWRMANRRTGESLEGFLSP